VCRSEPRGYDGFVAGRVTLNDATYLRPHYDSPEPTSVDMRGIERPKQFAATYRQASPDLHNTIEEDMVAEGDEVVMRFRGSGTHQGETEAFGPLQPNGWR
jgi:hypothetical protein